MKIGFNLIAAYCEKTPINKDTFHQAVRLITGAGQINPRLFDKFGFVKPEGIQVISHPGTHSFRLVYAPGGWMVYASFFGGRAGAYVALPGPNSEDWSCLDIIAPIGSKNWTVTRPSIIQPLRVEIEWGNSNAVAPSLLLQHTVSDIKVEVRELKKKA